ncbi:MAG: LysR family transcriptional regulator [Ideonella sp.]|nr:LysR family transcriptional regulator [Ideonella sp.]
MKLTSLRALLAAVEEGSIRSAARRIGVSQPALTKLVRELERELGTTLLQRSTTGVVATAQGKVLYEGATIAEREIAQAVDQIRQLGGRMIGHLRIAAVPLALMLLVPEALRTFGREFPEINLHISEELYFAQLTRLRKGEVDIALGPLPDMVPAGELVVEKLMPTTLVIVVRKGHPLRRARTLAELAEARWVFTGASTDPGYTKMLFERHGLPIPAAGAWINSTLGLAALLANGDLVGLMPQPIAAHPLVAPYLTIVPVENGELTLQLGALVRSETALKPAVRHFLAHLHRAAHHASRAG